MPRLQRTISVYTNQLGDLVIKQKGAGHVDDSIIVLSKDDAPDLVKAIESEANRRVLPGD